jgi:hypothetical protein
MRPLRGELFWQIASRHVARISLPPAPPSFELASVVHGENVRMIQRGEQSGFALKPRQSFGVGREDLRGFFDRDLASQLATAPNVRLCAEPDRRPLTPFAVLLCAIHPEPARRP